MLPFLACSGPALPVAQAQTIAFQGFKGSQLTCMFGKLFQKIVSIPVLWNIAHKQPVIVKRYGYANLFSFPYLIIIQLQEQWKGSQLCLGQRGGEGLVCVKERTEPAWQPAATSYWCTLPVNLPNSSSISSLPFDFGMFPTKRRRFGTLMLIFSVLPGLISWLSNCWLKIMPEFHDLDQIPNTKFSHIGFTKQKTNLAVQNKILINPFRHFYETFANFHYKTQMLLVYVCLFYLNIPISSEFCLKLYNWYPSNFKKIQKK